jgi:hypothetical protein
LHQTVLDSSNTGPYAKLETAEAKYSSRILEEVRSNVVDGTQSIDMARYPNLLNTI